MTFHENQHFLVKKPLQKTKKRHQKKAKILKMAGIKRKKTE